MTDYSQLPPLNPIAPLSEEPWLQLTPSHMPKWKFAIWLLACGLSLLMTLVTALLMCGAYEAAASYSHRLCGNIFSPETYLELGLCPLLINVAFWMATHRSSTPWAAWLRRMALITIPLLIGMYSGIEIGRILPAPEFEFWQQRKLP